MKKVFIKYNPYKLETEITVDGRKLAENSKLREKTKSDSRLQEWVEELPQILVSEYNDTAFEVLFHGTMPDYEDLDEALAEAYDNKLLTKVKLERKAAKETSDKEKLIDEVFKKICEGPFDELHDSEVRDAFEHAKSSDFEVCVVATMSAGKSTLINSMLQRKLMPSKQEACTAIITKIRDNDASSWRAEVYSKGGKLRETHEELTYPIMERLNADEMVSMIKTEGDIPFVTAEDVSLVLIDTPGPNNSRDPEHGKVQSEFLGKSSKSLVLYIMEGTFGSDDDNALLQRVADSMAVGGKQSKDRFIFVVNKMDDRRKEDGDTEQTLGRVREYLKRHRITNPNLFPAAALPALNIRLLQNGEEMDEDTSDETEMKVRKLNRNENLHFEKYASLPSGVRGKINEQLSEAINGDDVYGQALIHTGIPSVEAAIRQYVQKYAKTAKIKNIVDTFMRKLEEKKYDVGLKHELASSEKKSEEIVQQIAFIRGKIDDMKAAQNFTSEVDSTLEKMRADSNEAVEKIIENFQKKITEKIDAFTNEEWGIEEAEDEVERLGRFANRLKPDFKEDLDELVLTNVNGTGDRLMNEYKKKLASLTEGMDSSIFSGIVIDPLKLMEGSVIATDDFSVKRFLKTKNVEDGTEWVKNTDKKWYKPWTWFQESGYYRTKYKEVSYVPAEECAQIYLEPVQTNLYEAGEEVKGYIIKQSEKIAAAYQLEFARLDEVLKDKLAELESFAMDREKAKERICDSKKKLEWLDEIKKEMESIMEI